MEIILGAVVSLITQGIKKYFGTSELGSLAAVVIISLIGAGAYYFLANSIYWETLSQIFISAGAFYAFIIKRFQK